MSGEGRGPAIGIDLGTTYSCVGFWRNDRVEILENDQGNRITPSYVAFTDSERLDGNAAHNQAIFNPVNTIFDAKRLIGRKFSDETVQSDMKLWPFKVISGTDDKPVINVTYKGEKKQLAAEEISSFVLTRMKQTAEDKIGTSVKDAVITVPAYFDQSQRQATMDAAEIAGINVLSIINEPTAAAIAYGLENSWSSSNKRNVVVFDLGGGTFDVSILTMEKGKIQVRATGGDTHLGGEDFDNNIVNHFIEQFNRNNNRNIRSNPKAIRKLRSACEKAKRILSSASSVVIEIDTLDGVDFYAKLTRAKFEELNHDLFKKCMDIVEECLKDAQMDKKSVDDVVLVGGSSRIPKVQQLLRDFLNGKELCKSINPDEAVAYGAAVHAAKLSGQGNERILGFELVEVTPLSIGIESRGTVMDVVFPRNTTIPATKTLVRTTVEDNQPSVTFKVFEGERARTADNKLLGEFTMTNLVPAPRGIPFLELRFDLKQDGILNVSATDKSSGREHSIVVSSGRLSRQQMEEMAEVARNYKAEDEMYRRKEEARVEFEKCVYEMRDKLGMMTVASVKGAIREALEWLDGMNDDELAEVHEFENKTKELKLMRLFSVN